MSFRQFAATSQFYLYGTRYCTRTGWERASHQYPQPDELDTVNLSNHVFIVTGANSGIGFECSSFLAKKDATVYMVCRNHERAEAAKFKIIEKFPHNDKIHIILGDCSLQCGVQKIWNDFSSHRKSLGFDEVTMRLDGLLCNAGGLNCESIITTTSEGIETTFAAHLLFGTYHLVNLALPVLERTPNARVIVVSSGGMYNTKFPSWNRATSRRGTFDGQFAYAYAKRGQVLLCEEWTKKYPNVTFASCHPGWVDTPGVDAAYGANKSYLEPLRNLWQGSEGILWLLVTSDKIEGGGFYLDRSPSRKHMAGAFFTDGDFTKNTPEEVQKMMELLEKWSTLPFDQGPLEELLPEEKVSRINYEAAKCPLTAMTESLDIQRYMGRWYVQANIPTYFDKGTINNTEDYKWDEERQKVLVSFKYSAAVTKAEGDDGKKNTITPGPVQEILQHGTLMNDQASEWALRVKLLFYIPVPARYLVLAVDEEVSKDEGSSSDEASMYQSCMIGVADRSALWIMNRDKSPMKEEVLAAYVLKANLLGYDVSKIGRVPIVEPIQ